MLCATPKRSSSPRIASFNGFRTSTPNSKTGNRSCPITANTSPKVVYCNNRSLPILKRHSTPKKSHLKPTLLIKNSSTPVKHQKKIASNVQKERQEIQKVKLKIRKEQNEMVKLLIKSFKEGLLEGDIEVKINQYYKEFKALLKTAITIEAKVECKKAFVEKVLELCDEENDSDNEEKMESPSKPLFINKNTTPVTHKKNIAFYLQKEVKEKEKVDMKIREEQKEFVKAMIENFKEGLLEGDTEVKFSEYYKEFKASLKTAITNEAKEECKKAFVEKVSMLQEEEEDSDNEEIEIEQDATTPSNSYEGDKESSDEEEEIDEEEYFIPMKAEEREKNENEKDGEGSSDYVGSSDCGGSTSSGVEEEKLVEERRRKIKKKKAE